jgi:hypothetical protein
LKGAEKLQQALLQMNGIPIIAESLCRAFPGVIGEKLPEELLLFFESLTIPALQVQMVEHVWLNFDLAAKFGALREFFFSATLITYQISPASFQSLAVFDSVVYQTVQMANSENGDFLWGMIERFINGKGGAAGFAKLVYIALCHCSIDGAQRGLNLLNTCLAEHPVPTDSDLHLGLMELLKVPELQVSALQILDKIIDPMTLESLLTRATVVMVWLDPLSLAVVLRKFLLGPKGWMYLPLFVTCALNAEVSFQLELATEIADKVIESPSQFVQFTTVKFWYWWLFHLFDSCELDHDRFAMSFSRLLDVWLGNAQPDVWHGCFFFLAADPSHRWLRRSIFKYLLRDGAMSSARFAIVFELVFQYLFIQFGNTDRLHILLDMDDSGQWRDLDIAESLIAGFEPDDHVLSLEFVQKVTYVVAQLWRVGHNAAAQKIVRMKAEAEVIHSAFAMLSHVAAPAVVEGLEDYKPPFTDSIDSNAFQFFMVENALFEKLPAMKRARKDSVVALQKGLATLRESIENDTIITMQKIATWDEQQRVKGLMRRAERQRLFEGFPSVEHRIDARGVGDASLTRRFTRAGDILPEEH